MITPADPAYQQGPGAAYDNFYLPAYQKKLKNQDNNVENNEFDKLKNNLLVEEELQAKRRAAGQKKAMFTYFLLNKPLDLKSVIYFDDDQECLTAIETVASDRTKNATFQASTVNISTFLIRPDMLMLDCEQNEKAAYSKETAKFFLACYKQMRLNELMYHQSQYNSLAASIYSLFSTRREVSYKISAATKCLQIFNGEETELTRDELKALSNGRLKNIMENNTILNNTIKTFTQMNHTLKEQCNRI